MKKVIALMLMLGLALPVHADVKSTFWDTYAGAFWSGVCEGATKGAFNMACVIGGNLIFFSILLPTIVGIAKKEVREETQQQKK
jgi:hypothetical protein